MSLLRACAVGLMLVGFVATGALAQDVVTGPGDATGSPGQITELVIAYSGSANVVASVGFDIEYDADTAPYVPVNTGGVVDCVIEAGVNADLGLAFFDPDRDLFAMSFGDLSPPTIDPIGPEGVVQRCRIMINEDAELGDYPLNCAGSPSAASAAGADLTVECQDGTLSIVAPPTPTNTPVEPTVTNTPEPTDTPEPTNTTAPTNTRVSGGGGDDDDGCQVVAPANSSAGWLLLIPAAALLWQRRRSR